MATILAFLTVWIVFAVMLLLILPRPTDDERAAEDAEFVAELAKRRGDRT